jgi:histidyl-tRNA synthetase
MCLGDQNIETGLKIFKNLKSCEKIICEITFEKKFQKMLEKANKNASNYAIFVGDDEILQNQFLIRDLKTGEQQALEIEKIKDFFETKEII